jgi:hypothetical protein
MRLNRGNVNETTPRQLALLGSLMKHVDSTQLVENCSETDLCQLLRLSAANKVPLVLCEKLTNSCAPLPNSVKDFCGAQLQRLEAHVVLSQQLSELASGAHLDLLFIKTIRPYAYAGSDIDVILSSDREFKRFVEVLGVCGYRILEKGNREATLETELKGEPYLVDVHNDISAAGMVYFDKHLLWEDKVKVDVRGHDAYIPSPEAELVLLATHTVFKELQVTLADVLHAVHLVNQVDWEKVSDIVYKQDLAVAFSAFASAASAINALLYDAPLESLRVHSATLSSGRTRIDNMVSRDFKRKPSAPYHYRSMILARAYLDKFRHDPKELLSATVSRHALTIFSQRFHGDGG